VKVGVLFGESYSQNAIYWESFTEPPHIFLGTCPTNNSDIHDYSPFMQREPALSS